MIIICVYSVALLVISLATLITLLNLKNIVADKKNVSATPESLIYKGIEEKCSVVADNLEGVNENNNIIVNNIYII